MAGEESLLDEDKKGKIWEGFSGEAVSSVPTVLSSLRYDCLTQLLLSILDQSTKKLAK